MDRGTHRVYVQIRCLATVLFCNGNDRFHRLRMSHSWESVWLRQHSGWRLFRMSNGNKCQKYARCGQRIRNKVHSVAFDSTNECWERECLRQHCCWQVFRMSSETKCLNVFVAHSDAIDSMNDG